MNLGSLDLPTAPDLYHLYKHRTKKHFGQHFLTNPQILDNIVDFAKITPDDYVLEVGPGCGTLTTHLLATGAHVTSIEIDDDAAHFLRQQLATHGLDLVHDDACKVDLRALARRATNVRRAERFAQNAQTGEKHPQASDNFFENTHRSIQNDVSRPFKDEKPALLYRLVSDQKSSVSDSIYSNSRKSSVGQRKIDEAAVLSNRGRRWVCVSNLPYSAATPLTILLLSSGLFSKMVLMYQKEVAERICAVPKTSAYGSLTVAVAFRADVRIVMTLSPGSFTPPPRVMSAVVEFTPKPASELPSDLDAREAIVQRAFLHRRKTLANSLSGSRGGGGIDRDVTRDLLDSLGHKPNARAEELSVEDWLKFTDALV